MITEAALTVTGITALMAGTATAIAVAGEAADDAGSARTSDPASDLADEDFDPFGWADERRSREQEVQEAFERGFAAGFEQGRGA